MNKIIFLGTGCAVNLERQLTSILFVTDKCNFLIDCGDGMGTVRNIVRAGVDLDSVNDILITHHHADHIQGMTMLLCYKLIKNDKVKIRIIGPAVSLKVIRDIACKTNEFVADNLRRIAFVPLKQNKSVKLSPGLSVKAVATASAKHAKISGFAYIVSVGGKTIGFSSDSQPNPKLIQAATGADIMIHECLSLDADVLTGPRGHSTAKEAGESATQAHVKHLILTHLPESKNVKALDLVNEARHYFRGKVTTAEDLMELDI